MLLVQVSFFYIYILQKRQLLPRLEESFNLRLKTRYLLQKTRPVLLHFSSNREVSRPVLCLYSDVQISETLDRSDPATALRAVTRGEAAARGWRTKETTDRHSKAPGARKVRALSLSAALAGPAPHPPPPPPPPPPGPAPPHLRAIAVHVLVTHAREAIHKFGVQPL